MLARFAGGHSQACTGYQDAEKPSKDQFMDVKTSANKSSQVARGNKVRDRLRAKHDALIMKDIETVHELSAEEADVGGFFSGQMRSYPDLGRALYVLHGVKYIDLVSLASFSDPQLFTAMRKLIKQMDRLNEKMTKTMTAKSVKKMLRNLKIRMEQEQDQRFQNLMLNATWSVELQKDLGQQNFHYIGTHGNFEYHVRGQHSRLQGSLAPHSVNSR